eukprot:Colp12_sorted_trinity150504_noHs@17559
MVYSIVYASIVVAAQLLPTVYYHYEYFQVLNFYQISIALFCAINTLICMWEWALFFQQSKIQKDYHHFKKYQKRQHELPKPLFLAEHVSLGDALTLAYWSKVWSTYSLLDPSYSDTTTFGYCIDVGNGFSSFLPTLIFPIAITWRILSPKVAGIIGMISMYQMLYGTIVYFFSYIHNRRFRGKPFWNLWLVIFSNSIWVVFPLIGMYAGYDMIMTESYNIFL